MVFIFWAEYILYFLHVLLKYILEQINIPLAIISYLLNLQFIDVTAQKHIRKNAIGNLQHDKPRKEALFTENAKRGRFFGLKTVVDFRIKITCEKKTFKFLLCVQPYFSCCFHSFFRQPGTHALNLNTITKDYFVRHGQFWNKCLYFMFL